MKNAGKGSIITTSTHREYKGSHTYLLNVPWSGVCFQLGIDSGGINVNWRTNPANVVGATGQEKFRAAPCCNKKLIAPR